MPYDDSVEYTSDDEGVDVKKQARSINERLRGSDNRKHAEFGLCAKCRHFRIVTRTKGAYLHTQAWCDQLPRHMEVLTAEMPVKDCALFWPIGAPTLREMIAEAKAIEKRDLIGGYV